jgi:uncharacterized integral membrane protein
VRNTAVGVILILLIAVCALFALQNGSRQTQLSMDLGFYAWQLEKPVAIPVLIGVSFGSGLLAGGLLGLVRIVRLGSRVRELEQQATLRQFSSTASPSPSREPGGW